jgi:hypothetical protein
MRVRYPPGWNARIAQQQAKQAAKRERARLERNANARRARYEKKNRESVRMGRGSFAGAFRVASFPERSKLIGALGMLGSEHDGERANAAAAVEHIRRKLGLSWSMLIVQIVPPTDPGEA